MSLKPEEVNKVPSKDWTSCFFPGSLWQVYKLTGNEKFKTQAIKWTSLVENQKFNDRTHDMGFKIYCSFGEGLKVEDDQFYKDVIVESAKTFSTRFNSNVGSLRSWDFNDLAIPNAPRDASAAAVVTSALFELYGFTKNTTYLDFTNRVLNNLNSSKYILSGDIEGPFILNHSTGNWPKNDEIDEPISYADYYFLEALLRKKAL